MGYFILTNESANVNRGLTCSLIQNIENHIFMAYNDTEQVTVDGIVYNIQYREVKIGEKYYDKNHNSIHIAGIWEADEILWVIIN